MNKQIITETTGTYKGYKVVRKAYEGGGMPDFFRYSIYKDETLVKVESRKFFCRVKLFEAFSQDILGYENVISSGVPFN